MNLLPNHFSLSFATRAYQLPPRSWSVQLIRLLLLSLASLWGLAAASAQSSGQFLDPNTDGVILDGYDPVAFFTDNKPVKGSVEYQTNTREPSIISPPPNTSSCSKPLQPNTNPSTSVTAPMR